MAAGFWLDCVLAMTAVLGVVRRVARRADRGDPLAGLFTKSDTAVRVLLAGAPASMWDRCVGCCVAFMNVTR